MEVLKRHLCASRVSFDKIDKYIRNVNVGYVGLLTFLFLYPLIIIRAMWPGARWLGLVGFTIFILYYMLRNKLFKVRTFMLPILLFFTFALISAILSDYPFESWVGAPYYYTGLISYFSFIILFFFSYFVSLSKRHLIHKFIEIWLISVCVISIIGLLQYFGIDIINLDKGNSGFLKSYSTVGNSNDLASFLLLALPFASYLVFKEANLKHVFIFSVIYGCLLTTLCRSAWIALGLGLILMFINCYKDRGFKIILVAMILITLFLMPSNDGALYKQGASVIPEIERASSGDPLAGGTRLLLWQIGYDALRQSTLIGTGPDTFHIVARDTQRVPEGYIAKTHNIFLEIAITMGIPAMIFYIWFLLLVLNGTIRNDPLQFAFYLMLIMYIVRGQFLVDVISVYPIFWILMGFYLGLKDTSKTPVTEGLS